MRVGRHAGTVGRAGLPLLKAGRAQVVARPVRLAHVAGVPRNGRVHLGAAAVARDDVLVRICRARACAGPEKTCEWAQARAAARVVFTATPTWMRCLVVLSAPEHGAVGERARRAACKVHKPRTSVRPLRRARRTRRCGRTAAREVEGTVAADVHAADGGAFEAARRAALLHGAQARRPVRRWRSAGLVRRRRG